MGVYCMSNMQKAVILVSCLVIVSAGTLTVTPMQLEHLNLTQENFVLDQFMGRWYEVAVTSTCPHYMKRKRENPVVVELILEHNEGNLTMKASIYRKDGSCKQTLTKYNLTNTPGRFFHHVARFAADVDTYVVQTNYTDFAMMYLRGIEQPLEITTFTAKLYSRAVDHSSALLDLFKLMLRQLGLNDEEFIINQYKGQCDWNRHVTGDPHSAHQVVNIALQWEAGIRKNFCLSRLRDIRGNVSKKINSINQ